VIIQQKSSFALDSLGRFPDLICAKGAGVNLNLSQAVWRSKCQIGWAQEKRTRIAQGKLRKAGLSDRKTPKPSATRQRRGVPVTLYLFGGIQDDISVLPDQALSQ